MYSSQTPLNEHTQLAPGQTQNFSCLPETAVHNLNLKNPDSKRKKYPKCEKAEMRAGKLLIKERFWEAQAEEREKETSKLPSE